MPHLKWTPGAQASFLRRPWSSWEDAARVAAAILRFAEQGEGEVEGVAGHARGFRLFVPPFVVLFEVDEEETLITVVGVCRRWQRRVDI